MKKKKVCQLKKNPTFYLRLEWKKGLWSILYGYSRWPIHHCGNGYYRLWLQFQCLGLKHLSCQLQVVIESRSLYLFTQRLVQVKKWTLQRLSPHPSNPATSQKINKYRLMDWFIEWFTGYSNFFFPSCLTPSHFLWRVKSPLHITRRSNNQQYVSFSHLSYRRAMDCIIIILQKVKRTR